MHAFLMSYAYAYVYQPRRRRSYTRWLRSHRSPRGKPRSRRFAGSWPKAQLTPVLSSRRKASPGAHPTILNYDTYIYASITCALGLGIVWNPSYMIPRFP